MRFLATADLHLKKKEDLPLLERILDTARAHQCRALLIGGDLLDFAFPKDGLAEAIGPLLAQWELPVYLVAGNHDPLAIAPYYGMLPPNVTVLPEAVTQYTLEPKLTLFGCSSLREESLRRPAAGLRVAPGEMGILLAHGHFDGADYQPVSAEELADSGLSMCILGHIHKGEQRQLGGCRLLVPGTPQGQGWDETGEKFVYIVDADPQRGIRTEPVSVATRFFREQTVDLTGCESTEGILAKMEQVPPADNTRYALILTGEPAIEPGAAVELYLRRWEQNRVVDRTTPALSVEALKDQNTLQGAFVRRALAEIEQADPDRKPALEAALRLGLKAFQMSTKEAKQ